jgi:HD-like signal output (HDOD) protein
LALKIASSAILLKFANHQENFMKNDAEKAIKELVGKGIRLPPQPGVLIELQKTLASDNYKMNDLSRIISSDPSVTAMLFKAVRSPVFYNGKKFDSIEQVLMVIGIKQTYNFVQAISLFSSLSDASRKAFENFWTRSQEVAELAALIAADRVSVCNIFPDQAYMAGIFYECGVPVLMQRFPEYCSKFNMDTTVCWPSLVEEDALFNVDHCSIGYLVARHWNLPDFICKAILSRHEIPREELGAVRSLVAILQLALYLYHRINRTEYQPWRKIRKEVLTELGIHPDDEQEYYEEIIEQFLA